MERPVAHAPAALADGLLGTLGRAGEPLAGAPGEGSLSMRDVLVRRNVVAGVVNVGCVLDVAGSAILDTKADPSGNFGEGIVVATARDREGALYLARATLATTLVAGNARSGIGLFGASASLDSMVLTCNAFDIAVSDTFATDSAGSPVDNPLTLDDRGGNICGCASALRTCKAQSHGLAPVPRR